MKSGKSRMDTYNGTSKIINRQDEGNYGMMYKIVPVTTESVANKISCFKLGGFKGVPVVPQGVLPNATLYKYVTDMEYEGLKVSVYISYFTDNDRSNNYTLLIRKDNSHPVVLHFLGYDRLFGSHYDEYDIVYTDFMASTPDPSVFEIQKGFQCGAFPGPGANNPMSENPLFELVGARSYSHIEQQSRVAAEFELFAKKHGKQYTHQKEFSQKHASFAKNFRYINAMNRQNLTYKLAVNHMADYSEVDFRTLRGVIKTSDSLRQDVVQKSKKSLPLQWDWRLQGAVTPVKDQGICGSCWSFGTTGTLEGSLFIKHNKLISLSEQCLVDCSWGFGNNGCDGGESERAYEWIMKSECLPTESSYGQYLMQDGFCRVNESECGVQITNWHNTPQGNVQALVEAIYNNGPISVAIDASHLSFAFYSHGVYFEPKCGSTPDDLDHQVLAVGYGDLEEIPYILVKNSWSTHWGNDGYILMSQKDNNCGIATDASYADVI
ncbi:Counting factor associated protein D [Geodia barretti]|nr:Counting factor associated protein D [Geodia barretti]